MSEVTPTEQGAARGKECLVRLGQSLPAYPQPTNLVKPGGVPLDHPAVDAQAAAVGFETLGQQRLDAPSAVMGAMVISTPLRERLVLY
jgi:hypothetical protein